MEIAACRPPSGLTPYRGPAAWTGAGMAADESWLMVLDLDEIREVEGAMRSLRDRRSEFAFVRREDFRLPTLSSKLRAVRSELEHGRGFVLMRGLPLRRYTLEEAQLLYWGLGSHLGRAVSQGAGGDLIGHVRTVAENVGDPGKRGFTKPDDAPFHTDTCDVVGLMCWRKAKSGGESRIASAMTAHNILLEERPDMLAALYEPFFFDKKGEEQPGDDPYYRSPVFSWRDGLVSARYSRGRIETAQRFPEVPRLTDIQVAAMDHLDGVLARDGVSLYMDFQVGDIQWLNNYVAFHARSAYRDYAIAAERRHLLRLWLAIEGGRPLPNSFLDVYHGDLAPGRRGGIPPVAARVFPQ